MKLITLTQWFPPAIKPYREGVYEIEIFDKWYGGGDLYSYWNGKEWRGFTGNYKNLTGSEIPLSKRYEPKWRGLENEY